MSFTDDIPISKLQELVKEDMKHVEFGWKLDSIAYFKYFENWIYDSWFRKIISTHFQEMA